MASRLITKPLRSRGSDTDVRLRLKPAAPSSGHVDGSWWPRSRDLATELPTLLAAVAARVGSTERVSYHLGDWDPVGRSVDLDGGFAVRLSGFRFPCIPLVRGDCFSYAVACASILAKVERDRTMVELDRTYPQYGFAAHKGYGVAEHLEALSAYGPSPIHRLTYKPVLPREESRC